MSGLNLRGKILALISQGTVERAAVLDSYLVIEASKDIVRLKLGFVKLQKPCILVSKKDKKVSN